MKRQYKDSGIECIGKIPEEWKIGRIKNNIVFNPGNTNSNEELEVSYMPMDCLRFNHINDKTAKYQDVKSYTPFEEGDIVMAKVTPCYENGNIAVAKNLKNGHGYGTSEIFVIRASASLYNEYLFYYLYTPYVINRAVSSMVGTGGLKRINPTYFLNTSLLIPPLQEQHRIADYLDEKCGEVDCLIALQEKMIAQLTEYKQSVITEAVTKGLNPDVQLVPSGIDWIGDVPKGWNVVKLSLLTTKIGSGSTPTGGANVYVNEGVKFLRSQNVYFEGLDLSDVAHITDEIDEEMKGTRVKPGDVLLNITGGSIGRCYYVDASLGRANVNQHVSIIRPSKIETKYLKYYLQSFAGQNQVSQLQTGGNREGLSAAALSNFKILYPAKDEQHTIAEYLDTKCGEIDRLIETKRQKIEMMKEYKKSVIYECVTGKQEIV